MSNTEVLKQAIRERAPVTFRYDSAPTGGRIGHPHAIYPNKSTGEVFVDIAQVDGVSKSKGDNPLPSFRRFDVSRLTDVELMPDQQPFGVHPDYNSSSDRYDAAIAKI